MSVKTRVFDVKKLARNLDRTKEYPVSSVVKKKDSALSELNEYLLEHLAIPMMVDGVIPLDNLDLGRINEEDIERMKDAFYRISDDEIRGFSLCSAFSSFSACTVNKQMII